MNERLPNHNDNKRISWENIATGLSFNPEAAEKRIQFAKGKRLIESESIVGREEEIHNWLTRVYDNKSFKSIAPYRRYVSLLEITNNPIVFLDNSLEERYSKEVRLQYLNEIRRLPEKAKRNLEQYKKYLDEILETTPIQEPYGDEYDLSPEEIYRFRPIDFFEMGKRLIDRGLVKKHEGELRTWLDSFEYNPETFQARLFDSRDELEGAEMFNARNYQEYYNMSYNAQVAGKTVEQYYEDYYGHLGHKQYALERFDSVPAQAKKSLDYLASYKVAFDSEG